jgi:hypothetical protein
MNFPLPTLTEQKRLLYRPSHSDVVHIYTQLNEKVFGNELYRPKINVLPRRRKYWGMCVGSWHPLNTGSLCEINLMDKWFCPQWLVTIIAHEMSHQYQWDIIGPEREELGMDSIMSHGPSFFIFRDKLERHHIPLKTAHSMRRWFKYQDLFKC